MKSLYAAVVLVALLACTAAATAATATTVAEGVPLSLAEEKQLRQSSEAAAMTSYCNQWDGQGHCDACTREWGCGFCPATNKCEWGNSTGPSSLGATCPGKWNWQYTQCNQTDSHRCYSYGNCEACINDVQCGWCGNTEKCSVGNFAGPTDGTCPNTGFNWFYTYCAQCAIIDSCVDCQLDIHCGWCNSTNKCVAGNMTGPYRRPHHDRPNTCSLAQGTWKYNASNMCTSSSDPCEGVFTCSACVDTAGCGWCETTRTCRLGTQFGPRHAFCPAGGWHLTHCPTCYTSTSCSDCTSRETCGWCNSTNICISGSAAGPYAAYCPSNGWNWYSSSCTAAPSDACAGWTSCQACTSADACGWCDTKKVCMSGSFTGPTSGTCSGDFGHHWRWATCTHCSAAVNCSQCIVRADCGWCNTTQSCEVGSQSEPYAGSCPFSKWAWSYCPNPHHQQHTPAPTIAPRHYCYNHWNCSLCSMDAACGWCYGTQECMPGNRMGSNVTWYTCPANEWAYHGYQCRNCAVHRSCDTCTSADCGWCNYGNYGYCMAGNSSSPYGYYCPADKWGWQKSSCQLDDCSYKRDCGNCTTAASGKCGWCYTTGRCYLGSSSGPTRGYCPVAFNARPWAWTVSQCVNCRAKSDCVACNQEKFCGWCQSSSRCTDGNATQPLGVYDYCPASQYYHGSGNCPAPRTTCRSYSTRGCSQCVNSPTGACGWCKTTKMCEDGTYSGPNQGSCPISDWEWYAESCDDAADGATTTADEDTM